MSVLTESDGCLLHNVFVTENEHNIKQTISPLERVAIFVVVKRVVFQNRTMLWFDRD